MLKNAENEKVLGTTTFEANGHAPFESVTTTETVAPNGKATVQPTFDLTDEANARRLARYCSNVLRYCEDLGVWFIWNKNRWTNLRCEQCLLEIVPTYVVFGIKEEAPDESQMEHLEWSRLSLTEERVAAILELAKAQPELVIQSSQLDSNPNLLNVSNGTLDLATRELRLHSPADLITKIANVRYDPAAKCPLWEDFIETITASGEEEAENVREMVVECLSGYSNDAVITYFHGPRGCGKKTFIHTIAALLGDYAYVAPRGMLGGKKRKYFPIILGQLRGTRLMILSELKNRPIDDQLVEDVGARTMVVDDTESGEHILFTLDHKVWAYGRRNPVIDDTSLLPDHAYLVTLPRVLSKRKKARFTRKNLKNELSGILNWAIRDFEVPETDD